MAMEAVANHAEAKNEKELKAATTEVAKRVSGVLGNEPKQALNRYISRAVFSSWPAKSGV